MKVGRGFETLPERRVHVCDIVTRLRVHVCPLDILCPPYRVMYGDAEFVERRLCENGETIS